MGQTAQRAYASGGFVAVVALSMLLAACGTPGAAAASATPTCPPASAFQAVTGTISAVGSNVITVATSSGAHTLVHLTSNTRITKMVTATPADLTAGKAVQVTTDTAATTAQRILLFPSGQGTFGGRGGPGFGQRTPPAGVNVACFQRRGQGRGQPGAFQGLRGTVDSASSTQIIIDDPQGQTFTLAITSATVIETTAAGTPADLTVGATVMAAGAATSDGITARTITVRGAGVK
jgi:hypothetical protein